MYVAIRRYEGNTELSARLAESSDEVHALLSGVPGFRAYYFVQADDGAASVTVCDDRAGVDESTRLAADWVRTNAADAIASPPVVMVGEAVVSL